MVFHFDAAIQIMEEILTHELVNPDELYEILEYKEKDSNSVQEERLWKEIGRASCRERVSSPV